MQRIASSQERARRERHFGRALLLVVSLIVPLLQGCKENRVEAKPAEPMPRPEDCQVLVTRVCGLAGEKSPTCGATKHLVPLFTDSSCASNLANFAVLQSKYQEIRKPCEQLTAAVCERTGPESAPCTTVKEQVSIVDASECQTLLGRLDALIANLKHQEIAAHPLSQELQARIAAGEGPGFGPKDAAVTVVTFSDFECPYCARAAGAIVQMREKYADRVRFIFRNLPLPNHPNARPAALAALAANEQGKFWEFHDRIFSNQDKLSRADLETYARAVRLDMTKFRQALDSEAYGNRLLADQILANEVAVSGTPTLFVGGQRVKDPSNFDEISREIEAQLASSAK